MTGPAVVALGGGHGLAATLLALKAVTERITAVVTVADDGGSSGRLRDEFGMLPPGDLRMALAALAGSGKEAQLWASVLQHRFPGDGALGGHAAGNLLLAALMDVLAGPVEALAAAGRLLQLPSGTQVLPMSNAPLEIAADVVGLDPADPGAVTQVVGQFNVATTPGRVATVHLRPDRPPACPAAVTAITEADWIVFGPGSWFTSVLPHLMVPELRAALGATGARRLVVLNLEPQLGETEGFSPATHLEVFATHATGMPVDVVLADRRTAADDDDLPGAAESLGARLVVADVASGGGTARHDPVRLARAYADVFEGAASAALREE